jgi:hypothetical protein
VRTLSIYSDILGKLNDLLREYVEARRRRGVRPEGIVRFEDIPCGTLEGTLAEICRVEGQ